jgi:hypothetical protein
VDGPDFGYAASGAEGLAERYGAWQVNDHLELMPDLQWIFRPGADGAAEDSAIVGLRATMGFRSLRDGKHVEKDFSGQLGRGRADSSGAG